MGDTLRIEPTATAQWHSLVREAEARLGRRLDEDLESYLVFLLMRFAGRPELAARVLALDYLRGLRAGGRRRLDALRDVGDQCLLYSGLFPRRARRRNVRVRYFVDLGRTAYQELGATLQHGAAEIYLRLAEHFVALMDVLLALREGPAAREATDALEAVELALETSSRAARERLAEWTDAIPVSGGERRH